MQFYQIPDQCFSGFEDSSVSLYLQPIYKQHILTATIKVQCLCACLYTQCVHCVRETVSEVVRCIYVFTDPGSENEDFLYCQVNLRVSDCKENLHCSGRVRLNIDPYLSRVPHQSSPVSASEQNCPYDAGSVN